MFKIQKSDKTQIRIEESEFNGKASINFREWYDAGTEYKPTKKGFTLPPEYLPEMLEHLRALNAKMQKYGVKIKERKEVFLIAKTKDDAVFHKKHVYQTLDAAREKAPPDGHYIYWAVIEDGAVLQILAACKRVGGMWKCKKSANGDSK